MQFLCTICGAAQDAQQVIIAEFSSRLYTYIMECLQIYCANSTSLCPNIFLDSSIFLLANYLPMSNPLYTRTVFFTFLISDISTIRVQAELSANKGGVNAIFTAILGNKRPRIYPYS